MTTTSTSGAADLPDAMRRSTAADGKAELFNLPGYPLMVRAVDFNRIHAESEMRRAALLDEMQKAALAAGQATAAQQEAAYAALPEYGINTASHAHFRVLGFTADQMRAFADATHALRASHGQAPAGAAQADSVPEVSDLPPLPAPDLRDVGTKPQEIKEFLKGYATEYARTAIAARAPADSVLEDAARLDWLEQNLFHREMDEWDVKLGGRGDQNMWVLFAPKGVQGSARRIIDEARKQGATNDR